MSEELKYIIESLLFVADEPLTIDRMRVVLGVPERGPIREALEALEKAAEAERWPVIFLAGVFSAAYAPGRTDIDNPFINDEFNHLYGGVVLGARWHLDFGITRAKIDQAKAVESLQVFFAGKK